VAEKSDNTEQLDLENQKKVKRQKKNGKKKHGIEGVRKKQGALITGDIRLSGTKKKRGGGNRKRQRDLLDHQ